MVDTGTQTDNTVAYVCADAPNRLVAYALDALFLAAIVFVAAAAASVIAGPTIRINADAELRVDERLVFVNGVLATVLNAAYFVLSWTRLGASPAQRLLAMRLGSKANGAPLSTPRAFVRWALLGGPYVIATVLALWLPDVAALIMLAAVLWYAVLLLTTARDPLKQGLHDRCARSVVVKAAPRVADWGVGVR